MLKFYTNIIYNIMKTPENTMIEQMGTALKEITSEQLFIDSRNYCISEDVCNFILLPGNDYMFNDMFQSKNTDVNGNKITKKTEKETLIDEIQTRLIEWQYDKLKDMDDDNVIREIPESIYNYIHRYHLLNFNEKSPIWILRYFQYLLTIIYNFVKYLGNKLLIFGGFFSGGFTASIVSVMVNTLTKVVADKLPMKKFEDISQQVTRIFKNPKIMDCVLKAKNPSIMLLSILNGNTPECQENVENKLNNLTVNENKFTGGGKGSIKKQTNRKKTNNIKNIVNSIRIINYD